jgi:hypothetical protein
MRTESTQVSMWRSLAHAAVAALGVLAIVGSGGGIGYPGFPEIDWGSPAPLPPYVQVLPFRPTVQAGTIVQFEARATNASPPLSYQWRRNGVDIAGATGPTYTLGGAQLGDDGALFQVVVAAGNGSATGSTVLLVSPLPGVVFQDADFPVSNWTVTAVAQPAVNGPTHTESQAADGGNPAPYRSITYQMTPGPSSLRLVHFAVAATYNPATQGAIYTIDLAEECSRASFTSGLMFTGLTQSPMFEQAGRTYQPRDWHGTCELGTSNWSGMRLWSLNAEEFVFSGPTCGASEKCPDFSATAAPLRFGFVSELGLATGSPAGFLVQGIDNWKVTVWRK